MHSQTYTLLYIFSFWMLFLSIPNPQTTKPSNSSTRPAGTITKQTRKTHSPTSKPTTRSNKRLKSAKKLLTKHGCFHCHSVDGSDGIGPTIYDIYLKYAELENGKKILRTEQYLKQKIRNSATITLKGNRNFMPIYKGTFTEQQLSDILHYIRSLRSLRPPQAQKVSSSKPTKSKSPQKIPRSKPTKPPRKSH